MCEACRAEYENPLDRRFHAQPNACPRCGPQVTLLDSSDQILAARESAVQVAAQFIARGLIVAVKGLGGFHLMVDARNALAVARLRERKHRYEKPLAVMCPSLDDAARLCRISPDESAALSSVAAPIVLVRYTGHEIAPCVSPDNPYLGVMLPYTPLHHLLMNELGFPVVATSGNLSGEPIVTDNDQAIAKLAEIADAFLLHDRPIARPVDDSVLMLIDGSPVMLRRARGYAPATFELDMESHTVIATGAHQKTSLRWRTEKRHAKPTYRRHGHDACTAVFTHALADLQSIDQAEPTIAACDLHPDYPSAQYARQTGLRVIEVQHHYAHALACLVEHRIKRPALAVVWDGTGYGADGTIWGGEFLRVDGKGFQRVASLRPFPLPGGDLCAREPRRCALGSYIRCTDVIFHWNDWILPLLKCMSLLERSSGGSTRR